MSDDVVWRMECLEAAVLRMPLPCLGACGA